MVRVIMGAKGTGKTKQLIDMINHAADNEGGSVVCVEIGKKLVYDVAPKSVWLESSDSPPTTLPSSRALSAACMPPTTI